MDDRAGTGRESSEVLDVREDDPFAELAKLIEEPWDAPFVKPAAKSAPAPQAAALQPEPSFDGVLDDASPRNTVLEQDDIAPDHQHVVAEAEPEADSSAADIDASMGDRTEPNDDIVSEPVSVQAEDGLDAAYQILSELDLAQEYRPEQANVASDGDEDFGLDGLIASELDAELASFAETIEMEAPAPSAVPAALAAEVAPAKRASRPQFGAAMFGQAAAASRPEAKKSAAPVLEPLKVTSEDASDSVTADEGFDAEFAMALEGLSAPADPLAGKVRKTEAFAPERKVEEEPVEAVIDDFDSLLASEMATLNLKTTPPVSKAETVRPEPIAEAFVSSEAEEYETADEEPLPRILSTFSEKSAAADDRSSSQSGRSRNGFAYRKIAAGVVGVALLGGASFFVLGGSGETSGSSEPLIVKADADPIKITPPNPGGKQVANQHRVTYEKVANADADAGARQESLLSSAEKPINLEQEAPSESYENLPGVQSSAFAVAMSDARPASAEPTLQPRRVRTVTVLPDGTIVTNKETESIEPTKALIDAASRPLDAGQTLGGIAAASGITAASGAEASLAGSADLASIEAIVNSSGEPVTAQDAVAEIAGEPAPNMPVPSMKPTAPQRSQQVASLQSSEQTGSIAAASAPAVQPAAAPQPGPDAWYVQMSSQPSEEAAKASAATASSRYANIISGRQMVIQTADIPGKGTYHRVRLAASSKQEAIILCEQMKSAGGSCYVSR